MKTTTETKYTPGPWAYNLGETAFEISTSDRNICNINEAGTVDDEDEANARLIAAAPELLEALTLAQATIERLTVRHGSFSSTQGTQDVIRAALSKALP